ncbi:hypothetical protein [Longitalea luteola]|uniref:hypothetical protein n=1 Tax=Longitalea luteola TaxID=2812563 RepID=UPI001A971890|nr:hypothetical protein [Longitalea luteola]
MDCRLTRISLFNRWKVFRLPALTSLIEKKNPPINMSGLKFYKNNRPKFTFICLAFGCRIAYSLPARILERVPTIGIS